MTTIKTHPIRIAVIVGSTRPGRKAPAVADWVHQLAGHRQDASYEVLDLAEINLPMLDEPVPPAMGDYQNPHTRSWAAKVASYDGFVFVTPEYNHATSAALKNALDYCYAEWNNKAAGFVGYGAVGGTRAVEHLRLVMGELQVADVRSQVSLTLADDFEQMTTSTPPRASGPSSPRDAGPGRVLEPGAGRSASGGFMSTPDTASHATTALVIVDMQHGFIDPTDGDGVPGAASVLDAVTNWIDHANVNGWPVYLTRDVNPFGKSAPDADREGGLHADLAGRGTVVEKGPGSQAGFSGFVLASTAIPPGAPGGGGLSDLARLLRSAGVEHLFVVGLAADVCVSATAIDARRLGYRVTVDLAATAFVHAHPDGDQAAITALQEAGVNLLHTDVPTRPGHEQ